MREQLAGSAFRLLINSNTNANSKDPGALERMRNFEAGLKRLFLSHNFFNFIDINDADDAEKYSINELFHQIRCEITTEIAPTNGYLHAHCEISIHHYTSISFNDERVKKWFRKTYGLRVFTSLRYVNDPFIYSVRYMVKDKPRRKKPIIANWINFNGGDIKRFDRY